MARCSRCGTVETPLHVNGVPVCLDCDRKTQLPDSPGITEQDRLKPARKVQSISDSRAAQPKIPIVGVQPPDQSEDIQRGGMSRRAGATSSLFSMRDLLKAIKHAFNN
jgi:hypothetical protein